MAAYYLGSTAVARLYLGGAMVWQRTSTEAPVTGTLWVGYYDDTSVTVTASAITGASEVRFAAIPASGPEVVSDPVAVDATYNFARATITGLAAGTEYALHIRSTGGANAGLPGRVRTRPATREAFAFAFASCHEESRDDAIFDTIVDQNPGLAAFYHMGDRGYLDNNLNSVAPYHQIDDALMAFPRLSRLHRSVPLLYTFDDHDFALDNSGSSAPAKPAALAWYRARVPARPRSAVASDPVSYAHTPMPGVEVVMLDGRSARQSGQIISPADEAWLIERIQAVGATADGILLINAGVPWVAAVGLSDTWGAADAQRQRIAAAITTHAPGRVVVIAGDAHMLAFDNGTNAAGGVPVYHAAPLGQSNSVKGGPYSGGTSTATQNQYGRIELTPITGGWSLTYRGYSVDGAGVQTQRLTHTATLKAPATPVPAAPAFTGTSEITGGTVEGATLTAVPGPFTGTPTPGVSFQWRMDGTNVQDATAATFVRPSGVGGVPSVVITLDNDVEPNAVRTLTAAATTAAATPSPTNADSAVNAAILAQEPLFLLGPVEDAQWTDLSGNNRHATIVGTQGTRVTQGPEAMPFLMGTATCHAEMPHDEAYNSAERTILYWANRLNSGAADLGVYRSSNERLAGAESANWGRLRSYWNGSGSLLDSADGVIPNGEWAMLASTYSAGTTRIFVGKAGTLTEVGSRAVTTPGSYTDKIGINARIVGTTVDRRGDIGLSKIARFSKALTLAELDAIYQASLS